MQPRLLLLALSLMASVYSAGCASEVSSSPELSDESNDNETDSDALAASSFVGTYEHKERRTPSNDSWRRYHTSRLVLNADGSFDYTETVALANDTNPGPPYIEHGTWQRMRGRPRMLRLQGSRLIQDLRVRLHGVTLIAMNSNHPDVTIDAGQGWSRISRSSEN